jgi:RNA polymerase sigma-70 factor (ECF subfamily)
LPLSRVLGLNEHTQVHTQPTTLAHEADFTTFMRAYQDMVYSTAARLTGNPAQAEDIAQHVFLKAYENFANLQGPEAGGWLKTVVRRTALNHLQRYRNRWRFFSELRREDAEEDTPDFEVETPDTLLEDLQAEERRTRVEQALQDLPEAYRVPLVLYHFEELSYEDIARQLGVSLSKVKTDIFRGRAALARKLS